MEPNSVRMSHFARVCLMFIVIFAQICELATSMAEMRLVVPAVSDSSGHFLSHDLTFDASFAKTRHRRSASEEASDPSDDDGELFVMIHDDGEEILLQLTPNTKLVTPMTIVEWYYEDGRHVIRHSTENCFYSGRDVRARGHSLVAVSNCDGLVGYIQTNNESYFIEPLTDDLRRKLLKPAPPEFGDDDQARERYREQRERISRFQELQRLDHPSARGPRPHLIYKVKSIIDQLNLSVDQDFENPSQTQPQDSPSSPNSSINPVNRIPVKGSKGGLLKGYPRAKGRMKRSMSHLQVPKFMKGGRRTYPHKRNSEQDTREEGEEKKRKRRNNKGGKKRRNSCKKKSVESPNENDELSEEESDADEDEKCLTKKEKRERRREMKEKRRKGRERRKREREERKRERELRKRKKKERNKKQKQDNERQHSTLLDPLEFEEWKGYSPDVLWETQVAPGQSGLTEIEFGPLLNESDPAKWLELTVGVDYTVIEFHGEDSVEKYIFTLFNIVSAIYQDPSLEARLDIVLLRLIFYKDKNQSRVKEGSAKRSLESVNRWAETLSRLSSAPMRHDLAVWLTRLDLGGPSGYAPVAGVCDPARSCTLNRDEGLTSAFIIAHEMGHVLGMSHDGDKSTDNTCEAEGRLGSVMAPLVAATFGRFHWSRCSKKEYHSFARSWDCLLNEPLWEKATLVSSSIQYQYSLDDQCRMEFGEGFGLCRTFGMSDPCTFLWCSNITTPRLCKTKKGPPLEGTVCGDKMWCRHGFCEPIRDSDMDSKETSYVPSKNGPPVRHNPQHGGWSSWSPWGSCSKTCGTGIKFRIRECDNPIPRWGGRLCHGKREEWKVCASNPCENPGDTRAEQCANLSRLVKLGRRRSKLGWFPYESKRKRKKCRLTCVSPATNEVYIGKEYLLDGTRCSYDDPHSLCVQGKCIAIGCDSVVGSHKKLDDCGVCGGDGSDCRKNTFYFTDVPSNGYTEVVIIPKGAWKIVITESHATRNFLSVRDSRGDLVLNPDGQQEPGRDFISEGTMFHYVQRGERESLHAKGPLLRPITIQVYGPIVSEEVTITTSFLIREDPRDFYQWEFGSLSPCSASCGGGNQMETIYCMDMRSSVKVEENYCEHIKRPLLRVFPCNHFGCEIRWITGSWEHCSTTCGTHGRQIRPVSCVRTNGKEIEMAKASTLEVVNMVDRPVKEEDDSDNYAADVYDFPQLSPVGNTTREVKGAEEGFGRPTYVPRNSDLELRRYFEDLGNKALDYVDPLLCRREMEPPSERACNRVPCPAHWEPQGWTECSVTCGMGQQETIFVCNAKNNVGMFGGTGCGRKPREMRACYKGKCEPQVKKLCKKDVSAFCQLPTLHRYCKIPKYYQLCCHTCAKVLNQLT